MKSTSTWFMPSVMVGLIFLAVLFTDTRFENLKFLGGIPDTFQGYYSFLLIVCPLVFFVKGGLDIVMLVLFSISGLWSIVAALLSPEPQGLFRYRAVLVNCVILVVAANAESIFVRADFQRFYQKRMEIVTAVQRGELAIPLTEPRTTSDVEAYCVDLPKALEEVSIDGGIRVSDKTNAIGTRQSKTLHVHFIIYRQGDLQYCADDLPDIPASVLQRIKLAKNWYWIREMPGELLP